MQWILWLCIAAAGTGVCTERKWPAAGRADCYEMLRSMRIEPASSNVMVDQATSVEVGSAVGSRIVAACVQVPTVTQPPAKPPATVPAKK